MILSNALSRLLALVLTFGMLAAFFFLVVQPMAQWRAAQFAKAQDAILERDRLQNSSERLTVLRETLSNSEALSLSWSAPSEGEVAALVQTRLAEAAAKSGISFRSVTPLPNARSSTTAQIVFRLEFEADLAQLTKFLGDTEYAAPALPITRATLRRLVRPGDQSTQPVIFAQLDVSAPILIEDGS